jgi:hypothetical protein
MHVRSQNATADKFSCMPVNVLDMILTFLRGDEVIRLYSTSAAICRAVHLQSTHGRMLVVDPKFEDVQKRFWVCMSKRTDIKEFRLHIASQGGIAGIPTTVCPFLNGLITLDLYTLHSPKLERVSVLFSEILISLSRTETPCLKHLSLRTLLTDSVLESVHALSISGCAMKTLDICFVDSGLRSLRKSITPLPNFLMTRDRYAKLMYIFDPQVDSLEVLKIKLEYEPEIGAPEEFGGESIGRFPEQTRFIEILARMGKLRQLEYPFFPRIHGIKFSSDCIESIRIKFTQFGVSDSIFENRRFELDLLAQLPPSITELSISRSSPANPPSLEQLRTFYGENLMDWIIEGKFENLKNLAIDAHSIGLNSIPELPQGLFQCFPNLRHVCLSDIESLPDIGAALADLCPRLVEVEIFSRDIFTTNCFLRAVMDKDSAIYRLVRGGRVTRAILRHPESASPDPLLLTECESLKCPRIVLIESI